MNLCHFDQKFVARLVYHSPVLDKRYRGTYHSRCDTGRFDGLYQRFDFISIFPNAHDWLQASYRSDLPRINRETLSSGCTDGRVFFAMREEESGDRQAYATNKSTYAGRGSCIRFKWKRPAHWINLVASYTSSLFFFFLPTPFIFLFFPTVEIMSIYSVVGVYLTWGDFF